MPKENNKVDINKHEIDIDTLFKQNVNDLSAIKELYRKLQDIENKISQIKYIDSNLANKLKKDYEKLKKIILEENIQLQLYNEINNIKTELNTCEKKYNEINNIKTELNTCAKKDDVAKISSGTPLFASSTTEMKDTTKNYVNTTDGYLYIYNNGAWINSNVKYQELGLSKNQVLLDNMKYNSFGNLFLYDGTKQNNTMFLTFKKSNIITKIKINCKIMIENYVDEQEINPELIIEAYEDYNEENGIAWWFTNKFTNRFINEFKNEYIDFEDTITIPSKALNGIGFKINSGNLTAHAKYYIKNLKIYLDNEIITDIKCPLNSINSNSSEIKKEKSFIVDDKEVNNMINNNFNFVVKPYLNLTIDEQLTKIDSMTKSYLNKIVCWGDSITEGGGPGLPYPSVLQSLLGDNVSVINRGSSGQCSGNIAFRQGGKQIYVNSDFTIPSDNTQYVYFKLRDEDYQNMRTDAPMECIINGVKGEIIITYTDSVYGVKFKRETTGDSVKVSVGTKIKSTQAIHSDDLSIIWIGRNDIAFSYPHQIDGVIKNVKNIVNNLTPKIKRFLVLSVTTAYVETPTGKFSTQYNWIMEINKQLKELYPNNFISAQDYLVNECIYDCGFIPTQQDLECMSVGTIPPQVLADDLHPNERAREMIAKNLIYKELNKRGWII